MIVVTSGSAQVCEDGVVPILGVRGLAMVISIDAVRYASKLETADDSRTAVFEFPTLERPQEASVIAPARGVVCGLLLSGAMWVALVAAARAFVALAR